LFGVLWKKTTTRAANTILLGGTALSLGTGIVYFIFKESFTWPHFLMISFYLFLILSAVAYLVTIFDRSAVQKNVLDHSNLAKPGMKVLIPWIILIVVMVGLYILFNGH
jgi:solute:Na+ symporter, SSS family